MKDKFWEKIEKLLDKEIKCEECPYTHECTTSPMTDGLTCGEFILGKAKERIESEGGKSERL